MGIVGLVVLTLAFYPTIHNQAAQLNKSFGNLNSSTLALFGGTDFFSPVGYLNSQLIYLMLPLLLIILGVGLGSSLIGREEADGTIESLLARPISRTRLLLAKALAGTFILFSVTVIGSVVIIGMAKTVNIGIPLPYIAAACFACFMLVLTFSAAAFLLSATGRGRVAALGVTMVYALGGYVIGSLASTVHWLQKPSLIFPYHYYQSADILRGTFRWSGIVFFGVFTAVCMLLASLGSHLINDPRPFVVGHFKPIVAHGNDNGFPSDHTLLSSFLGFVVLKYSRKLGLITLLLAALIGGARMAAGIHHLEDVVGSFIITAVSVAIISLLMKRFPRRVDNKRTSLRLEH